MSKYTSKIKKIRVALQNFGSGLTWVINNKKKSRNSWNLNKFTEVRLGQARLEIKKNNFTRFNNFQEMPRKFEDYVLRQVWLGQIKKFKKFIKFQKKFKKF